MRSADPEILLLPIIGDDQTNTEGREEQSLNNATMHKLSVMQSIDRRPSMQQFIKNLDKNHFAQTKSSHPLQLLGQIKTQKDLISWSVDSEIGDDIWF